MVKNGHRSSSIDNEGKIKFIKFKLQTNEDLKVMWNMYHRYETKDPIEDAIVARFVDDIIKMLKRSKSSSNF